MKQKQMKQAESVTNSAKARPPPAHPVVPWHLQARTGWCRRRHKMLFMFGMDPANYNDSA